MASLRGERFVIDHDEDNVAPDQQIPEPPSAFAASGVLGDILERSTSSPTAPSPPSSKSGSASGGWPSHKKKYARKQPKEDKNPNDTTSSDPSPPSKSSSVERERREIDEENRKRISEMSSEEIEQERKELLQNLNPKLIERLMHRSSISKNEGASNIELSSNSRPSRLSESQRRVSFAVPDSDDEKKQRRGSAEKHSIPPSTPNPLELPIVTPARPAEVRRLSSSARKVSFSLPQDTEQSESLSTASSHSIPITPTTSESSVASSQTQNRRPSEFDRKVSFSVPEYEQKTEKQPSAASHSIPPTPPLGPAESPKALPITPKRIASSDRKVSFTLDSLKDENKKHTTATSHTIPPTPPIAEDVEFKTPPYSTRPSSNDRKVSFVTPGDEDDDDRKSTASHHSLPPTPQFNAVPDLDIAQDGVHFPRPLEHPELDPESETFLDDLHEKYFPTLAHDPSKLNWMKPMEPEESAIYDISQEEIHPKDVRFSFKGEIIPPSKSRALPTNLGLHHHGEAPDAAGYTVSELAHLARSAYPGQRCIAIQTLGRILYRLGVGEFGDDKKLTQDGAEGQRALLAYGLWEEVAQGHVIDTITEESKKERGHRTSIALAQEAVWVWQRGGGRQPEVQAKAGASSS